MNIRILPIVVTAALALAACGGGTDGAASDASDGAIASTTATVQTSVPTDDSSTSLDQRAVVTISQSRFGVLELRVAPGTTVMFENDDPYAHTITSTEASPMSFDSGELTQGETFEVTFDDVGEYSYFCQIHPTMRAVVIVG